MKCPNCGKEIANESQFCEFCGTIVKRDALLGVKLIDIRWALFASMVIATIAMYYSLYSHRLIQFGLWDHTTLYALLIPICLFLITCWLGIKKKVRMSFILAMGLFLSANGMMFYASVNTNHCYRYEVQIDWDDEEVYDYCGSVYLSTPYNYSIRDEKRAKEELIQMQLALMESMSKDGKKIHPQNHAIINGEMHNGVVVIGKYYPFLSGWAIWIPIFTFIIYIIYSFIATKKNWMF